jgi:SAM-dependent methyltransferase
MLLSRRFLETDKPNWECTSEQKSHLDAVREKIKTGYYQSELQDCPTCDSNDQVTIALRDRNGLPCNTTVCRRCGLLQTNPRFRDCDYADFYRHHYRPIMADPNRASGRVVSNKQFETQVQSVTINERFKFISESIGDGKKRILEVGCGSGALIWHFDRAGHECLGLDYDEANLEIGRDFDLNLGVRNLGEIEPNSYDVIIMCHSLEHMSNPGNILATASDLLSPNGWLYVEVPNILDVFIGPYRDLLNIFQFVHIFNFTPTALVNLVGKLGFRVCRLDSDFNNKNTLAMFQKNHTERKEIESEFPQILSKLVHHERGRLFSLPYIFRRGRDITFPLRKKIGLAHLRSSKP